MSKIKEARLKADISQATMSKMLDIPKRTIEAWETGDRKPPSYVEKLIVAELNRIANNKNNREVTDMKYSMKVIIADPNTPDGMVSELFFDLSCIFTYDEEQYGNGHYVSIQGKEFYKQIIDLRYDTSFDRENKEKWLEQWARGYWSGNNGAWTIKCLEISRA